ncbi:MAG: hypothetical protein HOC63_04640 [Rhodospirillales bacterium]|nr:hypothetical protein [Rhodospirillales bacterium]MBT4040440.1 hypothetical protein [Rhodospirillales bacterium]MBT4625958.1 hypothetical protein [Rhodospirillales bacterium]MBT5350687.1 hypothetical protein [Rhodospirillales bacterium]MBT5522049.1 hypothetical protein [Rhodospirillales bacterium]
MDPRDQQYLNPLPTIPLVDVGDAGMVALAEAEPKRLADIISVAQGHYSAPALWIADRLSQVWLASNENPYHEEILMIADHVGTPGAFMLNMSFEWSCTAGVGPDPVRAGNRLLRTLDWPLGGLGRNLVVARVTGEAGPYDSVTWPGFAGVLSAMAPGRFSAAINQPPLRRYTSSRWLDWALGRITMWREDSLPPVHLLRQVFDQCEDYEEARDILSNTTLAMPAFFSLSGLSETECCVIERTEDFVINHDGPGAVANHWLRVGRAGHRRGIDSPGRLNQINNTLRNDTPNNFAWVAPPILNSDTRMSMVANAKSGSLMVMGWERNARTGCVEPATNIYER